jgi:hypothetical protein
MADDRPILLANVPPEILGRYVKLWQEMPRSRQTEQGWRDLLTCLRAELRRLEHTDCDEELQMVNARLNEATALLRKWIAQDDCGCSECVAMIRETEAFL